MDFIDWNHHAYLIEGGVALEEAVLKNLKKEGLERVANPDFLLISEESLSVENARKIKDFQSKKAFAGKKKIIFISIQRATREAQNALLKTLEEPSPNTFFFILVPNRNVLLPTVQSRLQVLEHTEKSSGDSFSLFLKSSLKKRLEMTEEIIKEKDKQKANELLEGILEYLPPEKNSRYLNEILELKKYLKDRSPSLKQILDYTVINFPN